MMQFTYKSNKVQTLTDEEVYKQIASGNTNKTKLKKQHDYMNIVFRNVFTFFNILLFAIFIVLIICQRYFQTFFFVIVVLNTLIAIIQEIRAKKQIEKLKLVSDSKVEVVRNDKKTSIDKEDVVLNDVLFIKSGQQIVVDGVLLQGEVFVDESMLTGEANDVHKKKEDLLLSGSYVIKGSGYMLTTKVGDETYISNLQNKTKKHKSINSSIFKTLNKLIKLITIILIPLAIWAFYNNYFLHPQGDFNTPILAFDNPLSYAISKTAGGVVGMIPSGLFLLTSVALAKGVISLARKKTLVNNLYSIENLARVDCLCLDKTGTLTTNKLTVENILYLSKDRNYVNIMSNFVHNFADANLTMQSLQIYFNKEYEHLNVSEVCEFDSISKCSKMKIENVEYILGAPEYVYDFKDNKYITNLLTKYRDGGKRILFFVEKDNDKTKLISVIIILEELRKNVKNTLEWFYKNEVNLKIISGDNLQTVQQIAKKVGFMEYKNGISLQNVNLEETRKLALKYSIFARVSPEQKEVIIDELKKHGSYVGMTGDGVNDLLALKKSDCAIAMGEGSQAAKSLADITLLDNDFNRLPFVVKQGRQVINNIQASSSLFLSRTFFSIFITFLTNILGLTMNVTSMFTTNNLYLISVCGIGVPGVLLALRPNDALIKKDFYKKMIFESFPGCIGMCFVVVVGLLMNYSNFFSGIAVIGNANDVLTCGLNTSIVIGMLFVNWTLLFIISYPFNKWSLMIILGVIIIAFIYVFVGPVVLKDKTYEISGIDVTTLNFNMWMSILIYLISVPVLVVSLLFLFRFLLKYKSYVYRKIILKKN